jgi:glutathione S-transferase
MMKLHDSMGPNPRLVRMFLAEKGMEVELVPVDLMAGENRQPEYLQKNPTGQLPCLELDEGSFLSETLVICEYIEDVHPTPALIGSNAKEKAETRMWVRRIDLNINSNMANAFRFGPGHSLFKDRIRTIPQASDDLKLLAAEQLAWLDGQMEGRAFIVGERFSMADIILFAFLEFGSNFGQPMAPELKNIARWYESVAARPATQASA